MEKKEKAPAVTFSSPDWQKNMDQIIQVLKELDDPLVADYDETLTYKELTEKNIKWCYFCGSRLSPRWYPCPVWGTDALCNAHGVRAYIPGRIAYLRGGQNTLNMAPWHKLYPQHPTSPCSPQANSTLKFLTLRVRNKIKNKPRKKKYIPKISRSSKIVENNTKQPSSKPVPKRYHSPRSSSPPRNSRKRKRRSKTVSAQNRVCSTVCIDLTSEEVFSFRNITPSSEDSYSSSDDSDSSSEDMYSSSEDMYSSSEDSDSDDMCSSSEDSDSSSEDMCSSSKDMHSSSEDINSTSEYISSTSEPAKKKACYALRGCRLSRVTVVGPPTVEPCDVIGHVIWKDQTNGITFQSVWKDSPDGKKAFRWLSRHWPTKGVAEDQFDAGRKCLNFAFLKSKRGFIVCAAMLDFIDFQRKYRPFGATPCIRILLMTTADNHLRSGHAHYLTACIKDMVMHYSGKHKFIPLYLSSLEDATPYWKKKELGFVDLYQPTYPRVDLNAFPDTRSLVCWVGNHVTKNRTYHRDRYYASQIDSKHMHMCQFVKGHCWCLGSEGWAYS